MFQNIQKEQNYQKHNKMKSNHLNLKFAPLFVRNHSFREQLQRSCHRQMIIVMQYLNIITCLQTTTDSTHKPMRQKTSSIYPTQCHSVLPISQLLLLSDDIKNVINKAKGAQFQFYNIKKKFEADGIGSIPIEFPLHFLKYPKCTL